MAEDAIEIKIQLEVQDLASFAHKHNKTAKGGYKKQYLDWIIITIFLFSLPFLLSKILILLSLEPKPYQPLITIVTIVTALSLLFLYPKFCYRNFYSHGKNKALFDPTNITINFNEVKTENKYAFYSIKWSGVEKILYDKSHIYLYSSAVGALIIPRRAFQNEEAFKLFYQKCLEYFNAAQQEVNSNALVGKNG